MTEKEFALEVYKRGIIKYGERYTFNQEIEIAFSILIEMNEEQDRKIEELEKRSEKIEEEIARIKAALLFALSEY